MYRNKIEHFISKEIVTEMFLDAANSDRLSHLLSSDKNTDYTMNELSSLFINDDKWVVCIEQNDIPIIYQFIVCIAENNTCLYSMSFAEMIYYVIKYKIKIE
jgi:hypothetical protein